MMGRSMGITKKGEEEAAEEAAADDADDGDWTTTAVGLIGSFGLVVGALRTATEACEAV